MESLPLPVLDFSCPIPWPLAPNDTLPEYPFTAGHAETAQDYVTRIYLETLWLPEGLMPLTSLIPLLRIPPSTEIASAIPPLLLSLDAIETKYRVTLSEIMHEGGGEGELEESMMWFADALREYKMDSDAMEQGKEEKRRKIWLDELEKREVQIQLLLNLFLLTLPIPPSPAPKKRKRSRAIVPAESAGRDVEMLTDRLCIWHALSSVMDNEPSSLALSEDRDWVQAWEEDVVRPLFAGTPAAPLIAAFHDKIVPSFSPPPSPPSSPSSPSVPLPPVAPLPQSLSLQIAPDGHGPAHPGYRRSVSVSSATSDGRRSLSSTRTGVNNNKAWAGKEVKMSRRAIGGSKPGSRQSSVPPNQPPPQLPARPLKRVQTQTLVMATPVKKVPTSATAPGTHSSELEEIMETPDVRAKGR